MGGEGGGRNSEARIIITFNKVMNATAHNC